MTQRKNHQPVEQIHGLRAPTEKEQGCSYAIDFVANVAGTSYEVRRVRMRVDHEDQLGIVALMGKRNDWTDSGGSIGEFWERCNRDAGEPRA